MIPDPMPWVGWPNGEKRSVVMPSAVIVTTDSLSFATTEVRSSEVTVVLPVLVAWAVVVAAGAAAGGGRSRVTIAVVPPVASAALSTAAATTVPTPRLRSRLDAGAPFTGCTAKLADGAGEKAGRSGPRGRRHRALRGRCGRRQGRGRRCVPGPIGVGRRVRRRERFGHQGCAPAGRCGSIEPSQRPAPEIGLRTAGHPAGGHPAGGSASAGTSSSSTIGVHAIRPARVIARPP